TASGIIMKALLQKLSWMTIYMLIFVQIGCGGYRSPQSTPLPTYCQPELPLLLSQPYSRLYVEVDTIEGVEIPEGILGELKEFLSKYCDKPGGIEIVRNDTIQKSEYKDRSAEIIANLFIDGPPHDANDTQTAYMYALFYDSSKMGKQRNVKTPHVNFPYSCVIYYDIDFLRLVKDRVARNFLLHEAGHVLGLCKNTAHGDGGHCANKGCIMSAIGVSVTKSILGLPMKKLDLCADCQKDIETAQASNPATKMSFNGPFLVRQEQGYWVASLPVSDVVSFSGTDTFDWQEALAKLKKGVRDNEQSLQKYSRSRLNSFTPYDTGDSPEEIDKAIAKLARAKKDPNVSVRIGAAEAISAIKAALGKDPSQKTGSH
ncbi:unnamed protein product, partial [marine sediment metagenome]